LELGGSLITNKSKPFTERPETIKRLCQEIHQARQEQKNLELIVGHGGGSYPHVPAREFRTAEGVVDNQSVKGIAEVQDAAARLNRIIVRTLINAGEDAVSIQPSACCFAKNGRIQEFYTDSLERFLNLGMLPVVFGDVALDTKKGCCILSTEVISAYLAEKLGGQKIILCGTTDGVLDKKGEVVLKITPANYAQVKKHLGASDGIDVTGGMLHKVEEVLELAKSGVVSVIINGNKPGLLRRVLLGERVPGTEVSADGRGEKVKLYG